MNEMVERIAAILRGPGAMCRMSERESREDATEILEAISQPTALMVSAGIEAMFLECPACDPERIYKAMIAEAMK